MVWLDILASLVALIVLEIVLGIDNLVFLAVLSERLPAKERKKGRQFGLMFAWVTRLLLLFSAFWLVKLSTPFMVIKGWPISVRDAFFFLGGIFLIKKATEEIHNEMTPEEMEVFTPKRKKKSFWGIVFQIALMDIIFSLDSVLTAVGLTPHFPVMAVAITIAILVMIYASEIVSYFISKHPTLRMLAFSFLILIGVLLIAESFSFHIPRAYVYFAMGFSLAVEALHHLRRIRRGGN